MPWLRPSWYSSQVQCFYYTLNLCTPIFILVYFKLYKSYLFDVFGNPCSYGNMALFYHGLNQTELALRHMARTLLLLNVSSGSDHPDVAATFINIAMMYQDIGRMNVALRYLQEALQKNLRLLGEEHIQTAVCYHALAIAFNCIGAYKLSVQVSSKFVYKNFALQIWTLTVWTFLSFFKISYSMSEALTTYLQSSLEKMTLEHAILQIGWKAYKLLIIDGYALDSPN